MSDYFLRARCGCDKCVTLQKADDDDDDEKAKAEAARIVAQIDLSSLQDQAGPLGQDLEPVIDAAVRSAIVQIGPDDRDKITDQVNDRAAEYARERAAELVGMKYDSDGNLVPSDDASMRIDDTTRDMLRNTIANGIADGKTLEEIADEIEDSYAFSPERAELIAATEVSRANSMGALESYQAIAAAGIRVKKQWIVRPTTGSGDDEDSCCEVCRLNAEDGAIDLDDDFNSGDQSPPAHPNCRCALSPVVGDGD